MKSFISLSRGPISILKAGQRNMATHLSTWAGIIITYLFVQCQQKAHPQYQNNESTSCQFLGIEWYQGNQVRGYYVLYVKRSAEGWKLFKLNDEQVLWTMYKFCGLSQLFIVLYKKAIVELPVQWSVIQPASTRNEWTGGRRGSLWP